MADPFHRPGDDPAVTIAREDPEPKPKFVEGGPLGIASDVTIDAGHEWWSRHWPVPSPVEHPAYVIESVDVYGERDTREPLMMPGKPDTPAFPELTPEQAKANLKTIGAAREAGKKWSLEGGEIIQLPDIIRSIGSHDPQDWDIQQAKAIGMYTSHPGYLGLSKADQRDILRTVNRVFERGKAMSADRVRRVAEGEDERSIRRLGERTLTNQFARTDPFFQQNEDLYDLAHDFVAVKESDASLDETIKKLAPERRMAFLQIVGEMAEPTRRISSVKVIDGWLRASKGILRSLKAADRELFGPESPEGFGGALLDPEKDKQLQEKLVKVRNDARFLDKVHQIRLGADPIESTDAFFDSFLSAIQVAPPMITSMLLPGGAASKTAFWMSQIFPDLHRGMLDAGIDEELALPMAILGSLASAGIETLQVSHLTPGGRRAAVGMFAKVWPEVVKSMTIKFGKNFALEMTEEAAQEVTELLSKRIAEEMQRYYKDDPNFKGFDWDAEMKQSFQNLENAFVAMPWLIFPGAAIDASSIPAEIRNNELKVAQLLREHAQWQAQWAQIIAQDAIVKPMAEAGVKPTPSLLKAAEALEEEREAPAPTEPPTEAAVAAPEPSEAVEGVEVAPEPEVAEVAVEKPETLPEEKPIVRSMVLRFGEASEQVEAFPNEDVSRRAWTMTAAEALEALQAVATGDAATVRANTKLIMDLFPDITTKSSASGSQENINLWAAVNNIRAFDRSDKSLPLDEVARRHQLAVEAAREAGLTPDQPAPPPPVALPAEAPLVGEAEAEVEPAVEAEKPTEGVIDEPAAPPPDVPVDEDATGETIGLRLGKKRSMRLGTLRDSETGESFRLGVKSDTSEAGVFSIIIRNPKGNSESFRMKYKAGMPLADMARAFEDYLNVEQQGRFSVDIDPPQAPKAVPTRDQQDRKRLGELKRKQFKTAGDDVLIKLLTQRIKTPADKWKVGDGVGMLVFSGGKQSQISRGFRVIAVQPESKTVTIRSVADTGLTTTGGDQDVIGDETIHVADLVRDRKFNGPVEAQPAPQPAPEAAAPPVADVEAVEGVTAPAEPEVAAEDVIEAPTGIISNLSPEDQAALAATRQRIVDRAKTKPTTGIDPAQFADIVRVAKFYIKAGVKTVHQWLRSVKSEIPELRDVDNSVLQAAYMEERLKDPEEQAEQARIREADEFAEQEKREIADELKAELAADIAAFRELKATPEAQLEHAMSFWTKHMLAGDPLFSETGEAEWLKVAELMRVHFPQRFEELVPRNVIERRRSTAPQVDLSAEQVRDRLKDELQLVLNEVEEGDAESAMRAEHQFWFDTSTAVTESTIRTVARNELLAFEEFLKLRNPDLAEELIASRKPGEEAPLTRILDILSDADKAKFDEIRNRMIGRGRTQLGAGIDPAQLADMARIAALYIKAGVKTAAEFISRIRATLPELGDVDDNALHTVYVQALPENSEARAEIIETLRIEGRKRKDQAKEAFRRAIRAVENRRVTPGDVGEYNAVDWQTIRGIGPGISSAIMTRRQELVEDVPPEPEVRSFEEITEQIDRRGRVIHELRGIFPDANMEEALLAMNDGDPQPAIRVTLPEGRELFVLTEEADIPFSLEKIEADYGEKYDLTRVTITMKGMFNVSSDGQTGVIRIRDIADVGELTHEEFHAIMQMLLSDTEQATIIKRFGNEEKAAEAFRRKRNPANTNTAMDKLFRLRDRLVNIFKGDPLPGPQRATTPGAPAPITAPAVTPAAAPAVEPPGRPVEIIPQADRPEKIGGKRPVTENTERNVQKLKASLAAQGKLTEDGYRQHLAAIGLKADPRFISKKDFATERDAQALIQRMNDGAEMAADILAEDIGLSQDNNEWLEGGVETIKSSIARKEVDLGNVTASAYVPARDFFIALSEKTGLEFHRISEYIRRDERVIFGREEKFHRDIAEAWGKPSGRLRRAGVWIRGGSYASLARDEAAMQRISDEIASKAPKSKIKSPPDITEREVRVARVHEAFYEEMKRPFLFNRVMEWIADPEGTDIPDAPIAELERARDIYETQGEEALSDFLLDKTFGTIDVGYEKGEWLERALKFVPPRVTAFGRTHVREAPPEKRKKNIIQRTDFYLRWVLNNRLMSPHIRNIKRLYDENNEVFRRGHGGEANAAQIEAGIVTYINEAKGYGNPHDPLAKPVLAIYSRGAAAIFMNPTLAVRNRLQNPAMNEDVLWIAAHPQVWGELVKEWEPGAKEHFDLIVGDLKGFRRDFMMQGHDGGFDPEKLAGRIGNIPTKFLDALNVLATRFPIYAWSHYANLIDAYAMRQARVKYALGKVPRADGKLAFMSEKVVRKLIGQSGLEALGETQMRRALQILAKDGEQAFNNLVSELQAEAVHFNYLRSQRSQAERGNIGKILGSLLTFPSRYAIRVGREVKTVVQPGRYQSRLNALGRFIQLTAIAGEVGSLFAFAFHKKKNPFWALDIIGWEFGGLATGLLDTLTKAFKGTLFPAILGDDAAQKRVPAMLARIGRTFIPGMLIVRNILNAALDLDDTDQIFIGETLRWIDEDYKVDIEAKKNTRDIFNQFVEAFLGAGVGTAEFKQQFTTILGRLAAAEGRERAKLVTLAQEAAERAGLSPEEFDIALANAEAKAIGKRIDEELKANQ